MALFALGQRLAHYPKESAGEKRSHVLASVANDVNVDHFAPDFVDDPVHARDRLAVLPEAQACEFIRDGAALGEGLDGADRILYLLVGF